MAVMQVITPMVQIAEKMPNLPNCQRRLRRSGSVLIRSILSFCTFWNSLFGRKNIKHKILLVLYIHLEYSSGCFIVMIS